MAGTLIGKLYALIGADTKEFDSKMKGLSRKMGQLGKQLSMKLTLPILAIGVAAVKMGADFEQAMMNAASVSGATADELKMMEGVARDMGKTTVFSAKEAADAMYFMASAGWKANQMAVAIKPTLDLAAATQSDLAFATEAVVSSLNQFQLSAENANRVSDVFASAIGNSQATLEKLKISMTYIGPLSNAMGKSLEETTATLMGLYDAGYDASMAGTALRMAMSRLLEGGKRVEEGLKNLGLTLEDVDPTMHSYADIIEKIGTRARDAKDIVRIFGIRAGPAMATMMAQGSDAIRENLKALEEEGSAARMAGMQINTFKGTIKLLVSQLTELAIQISKVLTPVLRNLIEKRIRPAVQWFSNLSATTKKFGLILLGLAAASGPIMTLGSKLLWLAATPMGKIVIAIAAVIIIINKFKAALDELPWRMDAVRRKIIELDQASGRLVGFEEFIKKAEEASLSMNQFFLRLHENKNDINKTMDELLRGQIDGTMKIKDSWFGLFTVLKLRLKKENETMQRLRLLYNQMVRDKEDALKKEKDVAEKLMKLNKRLAEADEIDKKAKIARDVATVALTMSIDDQRLALEEIDKILKYGIKLRRQDKESLETFRKQLKNNIETSVDWKKGLEDIQVVLKSKLQRELKFTKIALEKYKKENELTADEETKLKKRIEELEIALGLKARAVKLATREMGDLYDIVKIMPGATQDVIDKMEGWGLIAETFGLTINELREKILFFVSSATMNFGIMTDVFFESANKIKEDGKGLGDYWKDIVDEMADAFGQALADAAIDFKGFENFIKSLSQSFLRIWTTMVGKLVSELVTGVITMKVALAGLKASLVALAIALVPSVLKVLGDAIGDLLGYTKKAIKEVTEATKKALRDLKTIRMGFGETFLDYWRAIDTLIDSILDKNIYVFDSFERLDELWSDLIDKAKKFGKEGTKAFVDLIKKMREAGLESKALTEYIQDQLSKIPKALAAMIAKIRTRWRGFAVDTKLTWDEMFDIHHTRVNRALKQLDRMARTALAGFNAMIESGMSFYEALRQMQEPLSLLQQKYEQLGKTVPSYLEPIIAMLDKMEIRPKLFEQMEGLTQVFKSFLNTGFMTDELFQDLTKDAKHFVREILGLSGHLRTAINEMEDLSKEQVMMLAPFLMPFIEAAAQFGLKLPGWLRDLIDKAGLKLPEKQPMEIGIENILATLEKTLKRIDFHFPKLRQAIVGAIKGIKIKARGLQTGGIALKPQLAVVGERPEAIVPLDKLGNIASQMGGGRPINVNFHISAWDGEDVDRVLQSKVIPALKIQLEDNISGLTRKIKEESEKY